MKRQAKENLLFLCNKKNYETDILINNVSLTGIKEHCIWNELQSCHIITNLVTDLMHDLLEGVCHYDLCAIMLFLEELISVKNSFIIL